MSKGDCQKTNKIFNTIITNSNNRILEIYSNVQFKKKKKSLRCLLFSSMNCRSKYWQMLTLGDSGEINVVI